MISAYANRVSRTFTNLSSPIVCVGTELCMRSWRTAVAPIPRDERAAMRCNPFERSMAPQCNRRSAAVVLRLKRLRKWSEA